MKTIRSMAKMKYETKVERDTRANLEDTIAETKERNEAMRNNMSKIRIL